MTATCTQASGASATQHAATVISVTRRASGHSVRAMPHTACATTATAATFKPCKTPAGTAWA